MKQVVIVTDGHFPEGDAGAVRLLFMAKAMTTAGLAVTVLCRGKYGSGLVDDINYISLREKHSHVLFKVIHYVLFPYRVIDYLKKHTNVSCVYIYSGSIKIHEYCKKYLSPKGTKLIYDCVEWYSPEQFPDGERNRSYINKNHLVTEVVDSSYSVVAISRFLENYFSGKGIRTLRAPVMCDTCVRKSEKKCGEKLTLFYAGLPHSKDLVGHVLEAAMLLTDEERQRLRVIMIGSSREHLIDKCGISAETLDACADILELHGRKPREEVLRMMEQADFVMLIRDASLRYAKAGFPSKVVESLANATPIFCNISSDLGDYLRDGDNALLAESHRVEDVAKALRRGIAMTQEQKEAMSVNALQTAKEHFDYRNYVDKLNHFICGNL